MYYFKCVGLLELKNCNFWKLSYNTATSYLTIVTQDNQIFAKNSKTATCHQINLNDIQNICSEIKMENFDETFSECWTPEGITKYKAVVLRYYLLQTIPSENSEEFENKAVVLANSINVRDDLMKLMKLAILNYYSKIALISINVRFSFLFSL